MTSRLSHLECSRCRRAHASDRVRQRCDCGGALFARYDAGDVDLDMVRARSPGLWRYSELLPVYDAPVSLGEPETPLLLCPRLSERWGTDVWLKDDGGLPGGTFKARGAAVGISKAVELGVEQVVMPSAGNAGGAWALYAARAGIELTVTMSHTAPKTNQAEVRAAGARLELVDGTLADAGRAAARMASESGAFLAATFSEPYRVEGKKACWLEVFDRFGERLSAGRMALPRTIVLPVGGGIGAVAAAKAAEEVVAAGWATGDAPAIVGVQAARCAPIARAFDRDDVEVEPWEGRPETVAAGLNVPAPSEGALVLDTIRQSGGRVVAVDERDIVDSMRDLASTEGVFACPEGAATVAAANAVSLDGELGGPVVLYNTGTGAKYVDVLP